MRIRRPCYALSALSAQLPIERYDNGLRHTFVNVGSSDDVAGLHPVSQPLRSSRIMVSCFTGSRRVEDACSLPRTSSRGSAWLAASAAMSAGTGSSMGEWIEISQGVEIRRPSTLFARADARDGELVQVAVGGHAVVVARGEFEL